MNSLKMKRQDLVELYQLCQLYAQMHSGASRDAAEMLMREAGIEYLEMGWEGNIATASNPRGAGRKAVYTEETNKRIQEMHEAGLSKRVIAKKIGCSLGHVQDVTRGTDSMVYGN